MAGKRVEVSLESAVPGVPARIWPLVSEPEWLERWFAFADRVEVIDGEGEGRHQRMYASRRHRESEVDQVVTAFEPPRRIEWRQEAERLDGEPVERFSEETLFAIELRPQGDTTIVTLRGTQVPGSFFGRLAVRLFGGRDAWALMKESLGVLAGLAAEYDASPDERTGA